jgi:hypothetical protein
VQNPPSGDGGYMESARLSGSDQCLHSGWMLV